MVKYYECKKKMLKVRNIFGKLKLNISTKRLEKEIDKEFGL